MQTKRKYNIGLNGQQCIGPCYPTGTEIVHPIILESVSVKDRPFCPTNVWVDKRDGRDKWVDICIKEDNVEKLSGDELLLEYAFPTIGFTCENFLKSYYGIFSFESAIEWINNNKNPFYTNMRIINCAWKIYGNSTDIINDQLIEFYVNAIKKEWIKYIYPKIATYIYVDQKNKNIFIKENNDNVNENKIEKINYFNKKINTDQNMYKVLMIYVNDNMSKWDNIIDHNENIKSYYVDYIINKFKSTIEQSI